MSDSKKKEWSQVGVFTNSKEKFNEARSEHCDRLDLRDGAVGMADFFDTIVDHWIETQTE